MAAVRQHPDYGNWVSSRLLLRILSLFALFAAADILLWALIPRLTAVKIVLASVGALTGLFALYLYAARRQFAADGGNVQAKIVDMLTERIEWDGVGKALDVGCGSGALTIGLAKKYETAHVTGVDDWGGAWAYSKKRCEENSRLEGTLGRTEFLQASASDLPFPDGTYDLVVSNLTFHEVKDCKKIHDAVLEALRVLKTGGRFAFQDLFFWRPVYGDAVAFIGTLKAAGIRQVELVDTSKAAFIPGLLKLPFMVGTIGILYGAK